MTVKLVEAELPAWSVAVRSIVFGPATTGTVSVNLPLGAAVWLLAAPPSACSFRIVMLEPASTVPETVSVEVVTFAPARGEVTTILGGDVSRMYVTTGDGWPSPAGATSVASNTLVPSASVIAGVEKLVVPPTATLATSRCEPPFTSR